MKRRYILIVIASTITATIIAYNIHVNKITKELLAKNSELVEIINEKNSAIKELEGVTIQLQKDNDENRKTIDELKIELDKRLEELENINQRIEKIQSKVNFNHENVLEVSGVTDIHMKRALKGTGLMDMADTFAKAEEEYGVNAFFLAAIAAQESSWGTSERAVYQNNITGHAVYNSNAKGTYFNSKEESIMNTAELLRDIYLTPGSNRFEGYSVENVNTNYCFYEDGITVDYNWCRSIISIAYELNDKANDF